MSGMDGMGGMGGMGGMDMSSTGLFVGVNKHIAHVFWYLVAAASITRGLRTLVDYARSQSAKRRHQDRCIVPSRPTNTFSQVYDTLLTSFRELSYPARKPFQGRLTQYFTPPPLGQSLLILTYWTIILIMLFTNVFLAPSSSLYGYKWEKPAFRAAWISVTQLPLIYALSSKFNVISIVTGISYERLNWMHRWVSRTLFLTVIVHWAYFFHEWVLAGFVKYQFQMMPMVKYGFGAWTVIGWTVLTGFGFFRDLCYELWVLQHLASAGVLLWLVYIHVPSYARYNVWLAIGFVAFDRIVRGIWSVTNNLHLRAFGKGGFGYKGELTSYQTGYVKLTIKDIDFTWRAGQHIFLTVPACGIWESHPFTISTTTAAPTSTENASKSQNIEVFMKCHSGFTRKMRRRAERSQAQGLLLPMHQVFVSGPWGIPPLSAIERSNSLIFIASSTGASYTMPLLEHAVKQAKFVQRVKFYWIVRHASQASWFDARMRSALRELVSVGVKEIDFRLFVTGDLSGSSTESINLPAETDLEVRRCRLLSQGLPFDHKLNYGNSSHGTVEAMSSSEDIQTLTDEKQSVELRESEKSAMATSSSASTTASSFTEHDCGSDGCRSKPVLESPSFTFALGRPQSFDHLIRPTVEAAEGETVIVACGGKAMMAQIRTYVGALSDERAVHKGTGAQSIQLWTETYGW